MAEDLIEREGQLSMLEAALVDACGGSGRVALVSGEAGIGKTSLVERLAETHKTKVRVLWGACDSLFTPRPLGPLHDMAAQIQGEIQDLLQTDSNRTRLFSTVLVELKRQPCLVVFEDVHWADEATLDLLRYLGRRITQTSALLVLTYRDDELDIHHPLLSVLGDLASSNATRRIPLAPLSEKAVARLFRDRSLDAAALYRQTGGNPFYINEVLASQSKGIPASIRDTVLARAARLSLSGRAVLETAAIIGMQVEPWLLEAAAGSEADAVDESIAAGILLPQGDGLEFRHDLTRQTILELISPQRRPVLHRLVLDGLRSYPQTRKDLARLAHHAEASGDHQAVLEYAPAAAREASAAGAHREAAALYNLALRYSDDLQPGVHASLLEAYSRECNLTEGQAEAIAALRKAAEIWIELGNSLRQAEDLAVLAVALRNNGQNADAEQANRAAIEMLSALPPGRELGLAYRVQATMCLSKRDYQEAISWGERAIDLLSNFPDEYITAMAHVAVGSAWMFLDYPYGCAYLDRQLEQGLRMGNDRLIANLYAYAGSCSAELYQFDQAERYLADGLAYTSERDLDIFSRYILAWQAATHIQRGRWEEASQLCSQLMQASTYPAISRITALAATGRLRSLRGDPGVGSVLDEALEIAIQTGSLQYLGLVSCVRAEAAWLVRDPERTRAEADAFFDLAVNKRHPWYTGELAYWRWKAGASVTLEDWVARPYALQIAGEWRRAAALWEQMGCPYAQARALAEGDNEAQITALNMFERLGALPAVEQIRSALQARGVTKVPRQPKRATLQNPFGLTGRQVDILALLIQGLSNAQIASRLHISPKTADHHVSAILSRLDVHSREDAAELARQHPHFLDQ